MKIVSSGKVLNSSAFYRKKKKRQRLQFILLTIGFLLILASFVYFSRQERFLITEVVVMGEGVADQEEIVRTTERLLAGYYLWIIPRAGELIYPRHAIEESLIREFPRLKSVDLGLAESKTLRIGVEERLPAALYCADTLNPGNTSECYFLDEDGFIFAPAPSFSGVVYFVYAAEAPIEDPIGKEFVASEEFRVLAKFIEDLATLNLRSVALELGKSGYRLLLSTGGEIRWRRDSDLALIRSNLESFLSDASIRARSDFFDKILYLDLGTENKVFYRFKN